MSFRKDSILVAVPTSIQTTVSGTSFTKRIERKLMKCMLRRIANVPTEIMESTTSDAKITKNSKQDSISLMKKRERKNKNKITTRISRQQSMLREFKKRLST